MDGTCFIEGGGKGEVGEALDCAAADVGIFDEDEGEVSAGDVCFFGETVLPGDAESFRAGFIGDITAI